jgi:hypothetical protein
VYEWVYSVYQLNKIDINPYLWCYYVEHEDNEMQLIKYYKSYNSMHSNQIPMKPTTGQNPLTARGGALLVYIIADVQRLICLL